MSDSQPSGATKILRRMAGGDCRSAEQLLPCVYSERRALARALLAKVPPGRALQPTALVHEALEVGGPNGSEGG